MFRFVFIILVNYILFMQIRLSFSQNNDTSTVSDCNIEIVNDDLVEDVVMRENQIDSKTLNRVSKPSNCMDANPSSCMEAAANSWKSGVFKIKLEMINITELEVFCEKAVDYGGWLVIQRRQSGSLNFTRDWNDYKQGFGDLTGNYWLGLEKLHALTSSCEQELYIQLERRSGEKYYAKYSQFLIGDESESYILKSVGDYSGNAGDSLSSQLGYKFSTYDRDNDVWGGGSCAQLYEGGWWFHNCYKSHLNGLYGDDNDGVNWCAIKKYESLQFAQMMIRPTQNCWRQLLLSNLNRCI